MLRPVTQLIKTQLAMENTPRHLEATLRYATQDILGEGITVGSKIIPSRGSR
jgi:hypothetical protein